MDIELDPAKEQHFLIDEKVLNLEIEKANITKEDKIIEIGAGNGTLTCELAKLGNEILAFETDTKFQEDLTERLEEYPNVKIIWESAMNRSWQGYNKIVSNIPYSLSGPVIEKAILENIDSLTLIVGENFKKLLESDEKIGLMARLFFDIEPIVKVSPKSFSPEPRVNSWLINFKNKDIKKETIQERILKRTLLPKGKIKNAIMYAFVAEGYTKNQAREFMLENEFDEATIDKPIDSITGKFLLRLTEALEDLPEIVKNYR